MVDATGPFSPPASLREQLRAIVSGVSRIDIAELADSILIREELGIDSLMAMEIVANCERKLRVRIDEEELHHIQTIGDFLDLLVGLSVQQRAKTT